MGFVHRKNRLADHRLGWKHRHDQWILRVMGIVAIGAGVPFAGTLLQVPVTRHASMATILIVTVLWAVALGTELHALGKVQCLSVSLFQAVVVF